MTEVRLRRHRSAGELIDELLPSVLERGFTDFSLRSAAAAVQTSHKVLLHHFGSREALIAAILRRVRRDLIDEIQGGDAAARLRATWTWYAEHPEHTRLLAQGLGLGLVNAASLAAESVQQHLDQSQGADGPALRLVLAAMRGLIVDRVATGDAEGTTAAFECLVALVESGALD